MLVSGSACVSTNFILTLEQVLFSYCDSITGSGRTGQSGQWGRYLTIDVSSLFLAPPGVTCLEKWEPITLTNHTDNLLCNNHTLD